ncbi:hypothetical protein [Pedobacter faecalis]|uniref:hypothetical protein n=1 Tax=Pedobacter faecalis TaxID=3041495 RepID=UPI00254C177C|nr:hypothetical protein [Pedobacter sp. ELA7]
MKQMNIDESLKVTVDFEDETLPETARELQPLVWKEQDRYYCLLGPDRDSGIFGTGESLEQAISSWNEQLVQHLRTAPEEDEVALYVKDMFNSSPDKVW